MLDGAILEEPVRTSVVHSAFGMEEPLPPLSCTLRAAVTICGLLSVFYAQHASSQETAFTFDVASVRENLSGESNEGIDRPHVNFPIGSDNAFYDTGGVFSATNLPLISYLIFAYKITNNNRQVLIESAPAWVISEHYNIEARTDVKGVTKDQMRQMMQQLLRERFRLTVHTDTREVKVFAAVLDRPGETGPQLRAHPAEFPCTPSAANVPPPDGSHPAPAPAFDKSGFPLVCNRFVNYIPPNTPKDRRFGGGGVPLSTVVSSFSALGSLGRPVVDRTGLAGLYDFVLEFLPDVPPEAQAGSEASGPSFVAAVKSQLGLKLVSDKAPIEFVLVDHIEKPTAN